MANPPLAPHPPPRHPKATPSEKEAEKIAESIIEDNREIIINEWVKIHGK